MTGTPQLSRQEAPRPDPETERILEEAMQAARLFWIAEVRCEPEEEISRLAGISDAADEALLWRLKDLVDDAISDERRRILRGIRSLDAGTFR